MEIWGSMHNYQDNLCSLDLHFDIQGQEKRLPKDEIYIRVSQPNFDPPPLYTLYEVSTRQIHASVLSQTFSVHRKMSLL